MQAFLSNQHVHGFSGEACTNGCIPNHGSPRVPPVSNAYSAKELQQSAGE